MVHRKLTTILAEILCLLCIHAVSANRAMYYNSWQTSGYRDSRTIVRRRTTTRRSRNDLPGIHHDFATATTVARKRTKVPVEEPAPVSKNTPGVSFDDLSPAGKVIAGTTQIVVTTAMDFVSGFFSGYLLGTIVGVPKLFLSPLEPGMPKAFMPEMKGRFGRMNAKSVSWGTGWGGMSAAFGGFKTGVLVLRGGKHDTWNEIFSTAAAGAWFARKEGPQAMFKGALLYGGMIYFFSGAAKRRNPPLEEYTEAEVEF